MIKVVGVKLLKDFKVYYMNIGTIELHCGNWCIAEIDRGIELAKVTESPKTIEAPKDSKSILKMVRLADAEDWKKVEENNKKGKEAFHICLKKIQERDINMKLVDVHYTLDCGKIIFYFTAEERVDFRELVKDLVHHFKARIELRQIGVRDELKLYGGCGWCGREVCCATFLKGFESVQVKMAKEQNLILTPGKISGVCGRLMCCLAYEYKTYANFRKKAPRRGTKVITKKGPGVIHEINPLKEQVVVKLEDGHCLPFLLNEIQLVSKEEGIGKK
ncbi:MAG: regulatory iron-sulfur-containing complex subunit RicT [Nitrospirota bacterium]